MRGWASAEGKRRVPRALALAAAGSASTAPSVKAARALAVPLAFAVMSFVAAHCSGLPKLARLAASIALSLLRGQPERCFPGKRRPLATPRLKGHVIDGKLEYPLF